jgi:polyisoprenoid-binding protein YceI
MAGRPRVQRISLQRARQREPNGARAGPREKTCSMRCLRAVLLLAAWLPAATATLAGQRAIPSGTIGAGVLSFDGRATVGDFTGTTNAVTGEMTGGADLSAVRGWVEAPVSTILTGNSKRDRDLNKSMESGKYPTIRFDLTGVIPGATRGDTVAVTLLGTFRIHGVSRADSIPGTLILLRDTVRVRGKVPLNLKAYQIGGLSKAMGMLRMHEEILVHLDLTFASGQGQWHAARAEPLN